MSFYIFLGWYDYFYFRYKGIVVLIEFLDFYVGDSGVLEGDGGFWDVRGGIYFGEFRGVFF